MKEELAQLLREYVNDLREYNLRQWEAYSANKGAFDLRFTPGKPPEPKKADLWGFLVWLEHAIEEKK